MKQSLSRALDPVTQLFEFEHLRDSNVGLGIDVKHVRHSTTERFNCHYSTSLLKVL